MFRKSISLDSLILTGSSLGLISLLFGWLTFKPNRLAAGTSLNIWAAASWQVAAVITGLWCLCLAAGLLGRRKWLAPVPGAIASLILALTFIFAGLIARQFAGEAGGVARISPGAGIWLSLVAAYILIFASRQKLNNRPLIKSLVSWSGLAAVLVLLFAGWLHELSIVREYAGQADRFRQELAQHIFLLGSSVLAATILGIPLGIWAARSQHAAKPIFFLANISETIPSLALFGLLIAPLSALSFAYPFLREIGIRGVGPAPAIIALVIYSLLPIIRNTCVSLQQIEPAIIDAGLGMGMSRARVFRRLEVPLAAPLVLEGVRTASVQAVGNAAVAALIGAGGLGWFIFQGFGQAAPDLILLGAIPVIILAVLVDALMRAIIRVARPKGIRGESR